MPTASSADQPIEVEGATGDWIVLNASCDLAQSRCEQVVLARVLEANMINLKCDGDKLYKQRLEVMRRGSYPTRFLLADAPAAEPPFALSYVEFSQQVLMPLRHLRELPHKRLRLRSPIREQFGNWVGGCFSRPGPEDRMLIPPFTKSLHDAQRLRAIDDEAL